MTAAPASPIRVLIVDDHFFTRMGVAAALSLETDIGIVAEASCGQDAIDLYTHHLPDVTLMDGNLPDMHGSDAAREIVRRFETARLLFFSVDETEEDLHRAVTAGARGYLLKSASRPDLVQAVRTVASGRRYFPENLLGRLNGRRNHAPLSVREQEVLQRMAKGWPNKMIAADMGVSTETVKTFVARLMDKLEAEDRVQAVMIALERGLLRR